MATSSTSDVSGSSTSSSSSTTGATVAAVPALGTPVKYRLTADQVFEAVTRRLAGSAFGAGFAGREPAEGDQLAALVVRSDADAGAVDLQVFLAGNDSLWVADATPGTEPGQYEV